MNAKLQEALQEGISLAESLGYQLSELEHILHSLLK